MVEDGEMTTTDQQVADELAKSFQKLFTKEDEIGIPQSTEDQHSRLVYREYQHTVDLSSDSVLDKLHNLRPDKSPGLTSSTPCS